MHPCFCFPVWYLFEFRNDLIGWVGYFIPSFFFSFIGFNVFNCDEFERLWSECVCFVLLLSHQFFSRFRVDLMLHNAPNYTFLPFHWHFLSCFNPTSPCRMHLLYTLTKHIFSECIYYLFIYFCYICMLLKCHYSWGEHARKCHKIEHLEMRKKTDLFGCVFKCFWMQCLKTHKWHGCLPWYSRQLSLFIKLGHSACRPSRTGPMNRKMPWLMFASICYRSIMQQPE